MSKAKVQFAKVKDKAGKRVWGLRKRAELRGRASVPAFGEYREQHYLRHAAKSRHSMDSERTFLNDWENFFGVRWGNGLSEPARVPSDEPTKFSLAGTTCPQRMGGHLRTACAARLLLLCTLPAAVQAQDYTYTSNNGTITITGYTGPDGDVTIPSGLRCKPSPSAATRSISAIPSGRIILVVSTASAHRKRVWEHCFKAGSCKGCGLF